MTTVFPIRSDFSGIRKFTEALQGFFIVSKTHMAYPAAESYLVIFREMLHPLGQYPD
jgi:hypothetical protein